MKRIAVLCMLTICAAVLTPGWASAEPFEPLFRIDKITGQCSVCEPSDSAFKEAVEGKAYPFGTKLRTGRNSTAVLELSDGNTCRVLANAHLVVRQDAKNPKLKVIGLDNGRVDVSLEEDLQKKYGDQLNVETATAICGAVGTEFSVQVIVKGEVRAVIIKCSLGQLKVWGAHFLIPALEKGEWAAVSSSFSMSWTRVVNQRGKWNLSVVNSNDEPQLVDGEGNTMEAEMEPDAVVKIYRKVSPDGKTTYVTALIINAEGKRIHQTTFTDLAALFIPPAPPQEPKEEGEPDEDIVLTETTTTTTSTTTTTTVPPGDLLMIIDDADGEASTPTPTGKR